MHTLALLALGVTSASGAVHNMFVGNIYQPYVIHSLEFDDVTHDFHLVETLPADASHAWIAFNPSKTNIYGASLNETRISSYDVTSATSFTHSNSIQAQGACAGTTAAYVEASPWPPYTVYSASWPRPNSCGMAMSVDENGNLKEVVDSWAYAPESAVHGLALSLRGDQLFIYSADLRGDSVWTHKVNNDTGEVIEVGRFMTSRVGMHPRHVAAHPNGAYVYVVMESANTVASYSLDEVTGAVYQENEEFLLVPKCVDNKNYWSAEVMLSPSKRYLWVTSRTQLNTNFRGYISCFLLSESGAILERMFMVPTTTRGGWANQISPAFWSDEYAAMADTPSGYVQIWKMENPEETPEGTIYNSARPVAQVTIGDGGCCANTIWYS